MPKNKSPGISDLDLSVLGSLGLRQFYGYTQEEFLQKLRSPLGVMYYQEMSWNDSAIGAVLYLIENLVRQVEMRVEPADESEAAQEQADFIESCIEDMSCTWTEFMSETLSMLVYGWAYMEILYKVRRGQTEDSTTKSLFDDGKVGWRKFAIRGQDTLLRWEFDPVDGGLRGLWQVDWYSGRKAFIPIEKALLFRLKVHKGNPEGFSLLRTAVVDYFFYKRICEIEAIGIERDLAGLPTMEVPLAMLRPDADANTKAQLVTLEKLMREVKQDERAFLILPQETGPDGKPTGYRFRLMSSGGTRQFNTAEIKREYRLNIFRNFLAQFLTLGQSAGSWALASSHTNTFSMAVGNILEVIYAVVNRYAVSRLMRFNGVPKELWPTIEHGDIEQPPLEEVGAYIQALATTNQLPEDPRLRRKLLEIAHLPIPDESQPTVVPQEGAAQKSAGAVVRMRKKRRGDA